MANQDFLITFSVDGTQAIRMMEQIGAKAVALEARLNSLGRSAAGGGTSGGILNSLGLSQGQIQPTITALQRMRNEVGELARIRTTRESIGLPISAAALDREAFSIKRLADTLGRAHPEYAALVDQSKKLASQSVATAKSMDDASTAFGRHTARIVEAIIVYEVFARAIQGLQAGIGLIIDIDRESRRLEAVLGADPDQFGFIEGLGDIAINTVTPLEDLVAESDRATAAFLDMEDPAARAAASIQLMDEAGKFTTVTQRDLGTEISNVIAIMKQLDIPVEELGDHLGKIVVAGGKSSTTIAALTDALQISTRAAAQAGVNFDVLAAIEARFIIETNRTGSEVGNVFKTLFQRLSDPDVAESISSITNGMLEMRDAAGAIRDPFQILLDLDALASAGAISSTQFRDAMEALSPQLNPAAKADFILINDLLQEIAPAVREIAAADVTNLNDLVDKLNAALGPQLKKLLEEAKVAFTELFSDDILAAGFNLIAFIRAIGTALGGVDPEIIKAVAGFLSIAAGLKLFAFVAGRLLPILGLGGIAGAIGSIIRVSATFAGTFTAASTAMTLFGRAILFTSGMILGLTAAFAPLLVAIAAFMAIDFASKVGEMQEALKGQIGGSLVGLNREQLLQRRAEIQGEIDSDQGGPLENIIGAFTVDPALNDALKEIDRQLAIIGENGSVQKLADDFVVAGDAANDAAQGAEFLANLAEHPFDQATADAEARAAALANMSFEERNAAVSAELLTTLVDEQAEALLRLNERYKDGAITQAQFRTGQDQVNQAAQIATQLVAAFGDQLRTAIPEIAGAAAGNEALAAQLFNVIIQSSNGIPALQAFTGQLLNMAGAAAQASVQLVTTLAIQTALGSRLGEADMFQRVGGGPGITAALNAARQAQSAILQQIQQALAGFRNIIQTASSTPFGFGGGGSAPRPPSGSGPTQLPILDLGDLPADQLAKLIAMATALRNAIPGETALSLNELVAVIKDGQFLQTIKGIDDRLLRIALEELVEVEKERIALEKSQLAGGILSNLVTNVGPLGALISQPTTFGVGGSLALGSGLNIDPNSGNFVINVPINWTGMDLATLQAMIRDTIAQAIIDALRTG